MSSVYFHEDDYCQVEVLPASTREDCLAEMGRIDEFSATHQDGAGFTEMYIREASPQALSSLGIKIDDLRTSLSGVLEEFDEVYTGYSSYRELCPSAKGWGEGDWQAIFANVSDKGIVQNIWLCVNALTTESEALWCRVLGSLPRATELLLADWNTSQIVLLTDEAALGAYFHGENEESQ